MICRKVPLHNGNGKGEIYRGLFQGHQITVRRYNAQGGRFLCSDHENNTQHSYGCLVALSV